MTLARVEANLGDDEFCAASNLLFELEKLRDDFILMPLEVSSDGAWEKSRCGHGLSGPLSKVARPLKAAIHLIEHCQQANRVDIKYGFRTAMVTSCWIIAA